MKSEEVFRGEAGPNGPKDDPKDSTKGYNTALSHPHPRAIRSHSAHSIQSSCPPPPPVAPPAESELHFERELSRNRPQSSMETFQFRCANCWLSTKRGNVPDSRHRDVAALTYRSIYCTFYFSLFFSTSFCLFSSCLVLFAGVEDFRS
jgi:hypothetical protein